MEMKYWFYPYFEKKKIIIIKGDLFPSNSLFYKLPNKLEKHTLSLSIPSF